MTSNGVGWADERLRGSGPTNDTAELLKLARAFLAERAVIHFDQPIELASGKMSNTFIDGKASLSRGSDLELICRTVLAVIDDAGIEFDAVGGLTLGADHISVGLALVADREWFLVRKEAKKRGTARRMEGARIGPATRVLAVEDVVSTGASLLTAVDVISQTGAEVVAACSLVDRGEIANPVFEELGIPYFSLATYRDLGLPPIEAG